MSATAIESPPAESGVGAVPDRPIVFFDGVCGFCDLTVSTLLKLDRDGVLLFAPLQGETAAAVLPPEDVADLDSMVFRKDGRLVRKSTAAAEILKTFGGGWSVLGSLLLFVPRPLRDAGYTAFAKIRYRVWGRKEACRMPSPEERARFLD